MFWKMAIAVLVSVGIAALTHSAAATIAAFLVAYFTLPHAPGRVFALMLIVEGISRFLLETVRSEPPVIGNWSFSMVLSVPLVALGIVLWIAFGSRRLRESGGNAYSPSSATPAARW